MRLASRFAITTMLWFVSKCFKKFQSHLCTCHRQQVDGGKGAGLGAVTLGAKQPGRQNRAEDEVQTLTNTELTANRRGIAVRVDLATI